MKKVILSAILATGLLFTACSDDKEEEVKDDGPISQEVISGVVRESSFTAKGGKAVKRNISDEELLQIHVGNEETKTACDSEPTSYGLRIYIRVPRKTGTYNDESITFIKKGDDKSLIYPNGTVIIDEITENEVTFRVRAKIDNKDSIEGKFTLPLCEFEF